MTTLARLSVLLLAVLLAAGCDTAAPGTSSATLASPTPRPKPTPFPIPTPRYTMPPAGSRCPTLNDLYRPPDASLSFRTSRGFAEPSTVAVGRAPLLAPFRPVNAGDRTGGSGVLLGARTQVVEVVITYQANEALRDSARVTSVELTLELPGRAPIALRTSRVAADDSVAAEGVPDIDAEGILRVRVHWVDRCYEYLAEGPMTTRVASAATVLNCAVDEESAWRQASGLFEAPLAFGTTTADIGIAEVSGFLVDMPIIDGPYALLAFDRAARPAAASPAQAVRFHATDPELVLAPGERATVLVYSRADVIRHIDAGGYYGGDPIPAPVFESELTLRDGSFEIRAPAEPGRYVAAISLSFASSCYAGAAIAAPGLDVAAN